MTPIFIHIMSTGAIWISNDVSFVPAGTVVTSFRANPNTTNQLLCTLTGSGNASASALAVTIPTGKKSGKAEGNERQ